MDKKMTNKERSKNLKLYRKLFVLKKKINLTSKLRHYKVDIYC